MNIQLYIEGQIVDLGTDTDIQLEKSFENQDNVVEEINYSFDIDLPVTARNRKVFGFTDVFDVPNKFGKTYNAILNADEVTILNGKFLLNNISGEFYSGQLYVPDSESLSDVLGERKMNEIIAHNKTIASWDDIRKINNYVGGLSTTDIPVESERDSHICYPYVLYRLPWNNASSTYSNYTQDMSSSGNTFSLDSMFPAYNVLSVIQDVFATEGYTVTGNIFNNDKFTNLWQTFSTDYDKWKTDKNVPYYLKFSCDYHMRMNNNTSPTLTATDILGDQYTVGTDAPLVAGSANTRVYNEDDQYGMMSVSSDGNGYSITVPKSGWYKIECTGYINMPQQSGHFSQSERTNTCGIHSDADWTDFHTSVAEFQLKKTTAPLSNTTLYGLNLSVPCVPYEWDADLDKRGFHQLTFNEKCNYVGKNTKTSLIKDYSGFDTYDFIACASFGSPFQTDRDKSRYGNRAHYKASMACLPNPYTTTEVQLRTDDDVPSLHLYDYDNWKTRYDYSDSRAQIYVRDDSYSNFEGYNLITLNDDEISVTWDTSSNYKKRTWSGADTSYAFTSIDSNNSNDTTRGDFKICTVVWLEEGEGISPEIISPWHEWRNKCSWYETCDWKDRKRSGVTLMDTNFTFQMGIISTDEKWIPTSGNPIKTFTALKETKPTNVNQFLPETKVNDWLDNFLDTFNLKLSKIGANAYSIDTQIGEGRTFGVTIDIDRYANVKDAVFRRIDLPSSTTLGWTIDTDEDGYKNGNNTVSPQTGRDAINYDGIYTVEYDATSTSKAESIKSNWSYNWYKTITFRNSLNVADSSFQKKVPVITDADIWENTYETIQDTAYATDKTPRFFFLEKTKWGTCTNTPIMVMEELNSGGTTVREGRIKANFLFATDHIDTDNGSYYLDYNQIDDEQTITNTFFMLHSTNTYEIDIPVTLPNHIYAKIQANTIIKFNDGLYRIYGIEGHDVAGKEESTIKLIPLE